MEDSYREYVVGEFLMDNHKEKKWGMYEKE
jgi:hypothetical protein